MRQKAVKRRHAEEYVVVRAYSGRVVTCWHGPRAFCCQPISDEPRVPLHPGEYFLVTRWQKSASQLPAAASGPSPVFRYWLYGDRSLGDAAANGSAERVRGWFPRSCVRLLADIADTSPAPETDHEKEA